MRRMNRSRPDYYGMGAVAWVVVILATIAGNAMTMLFGWEVAAVCGAVFFVLLFAAGRGERI